MANRNELASMLLSYYNAQVGSRYRMNGKEEIILGALDRVGGDVSAVKIHINTYAREHETHDWEECFLTCGRIKEATPVVATTSVDGAMDILGKAVVEILAKTKADAIQDAILNSCEAKVREFIEREYGHIERKVTTVVDGVKVELEGAVHEKFDTVVQFVANNEPVYLVGPAGSGKNVLCKQVAQSLNLDFYFTNAVTQEYQLKGFTDAMGNYQETQFYKAFKNGGLFMLDEMDASIPEVLIILNAAIANGYFDFPAPIGYVKAHENFRVIAAGNTLGHGASFEYNGRNQLDGASLDRFGVVKVGYSTEIENASAGGNIELADFCRAYRKAAEKAGLNVIVSYRAIKRLAKIIPLMGLVEAFDTCLVKGLEKDDINAILSNMEVENDYTKALRKLWREA